MIVLDRSKFLHALASVQGGLSLGRETVVQGSCFVFKDGHVMTFNDEVFCRHPLPQTDLGFEGAIPAKNLLDMMGKFSTDTVKLSFDDGKLVVTGGRRRAGFAVESEILMQLDAVEEPETWHKADPCFGVAIGRAANCADNDEQHFYRSCVHIGDGWVEACNSLHMIRCTTQTPPGDGATFLVRGSAAKPLEGLNVEEIALTKTWLAVREVGGLEYYVRRYTDDYPQLDSLFEESTDGVEFRSPNGLGDALDKATMFANESESGNITVRMSAGECIIKGTGETGWFEESLPVSYAGGLLGFATNPKIFKQFVERYNTGVIFNERLRVGNASDFIYVTSLERIED